jgi:hypothetical protein
MASHRRAALWRTRIVKFGRKWWGVITFCSGLLVAVPSLYAYITRISVEPYSTVRSHEPMGTVFNLKNNGVFDLHNVTQSCEILEMNIANQTNLMQNIQFDPMDHLLGDLPAGAAKSLSCEQSVTGLHNAASIGILITYEASPLRWYRRSKTFLFQSVQADDGTWVWKSQ